MATLDEVVPSQGNQEAVDFIFKNAPVGEDGNALQAAAYRGSKETVEALLKAGANVNAQGGEYGNALQAAALGGSKETVEALLKAGANVNAQGGEYGNALQAAAYTGGKETVEALLDVGADINAEGGYYGSALQAAAAMGAEEVFKVLWAKKSSTNITSRAVGGASLLHNAVASRVYSILKLVLDASAKELLDTKDDSGQTPLHLAVTIGDIWILDILLPFLKASDLTLNAKDLDGRTPLHLAVEEEAAIVVEWLLNIGSRIDIQDLNDATPLERASQLGNFRILSLLLSKASGSPSLVNASTWRSIAGEKSNTTIMICNDNSITVGAETELKQYVNERSYSLSFTVSNEPAREKSMGEDTTEKRIFILGDDGAFRVAPKSGLHCRWWRKTTEKTKFRSRMEEKERVWTVRPEIVPSAVTISQIPLGDCFLERRFELPFLLPPDMDHIPRSLAETLQMLERVHAIVWIMVKPRVSESEPKDKGSILEPKTFFSTLEYAAVPDDATDLFLALVKQITEEWNNRPMVLENHGTEPKLIMDLLRDAMLWVSLDTLFKDQIRCLKELCRSYKENRWAVLDKNLDKTRSNVIELGQIIEGLEGDISQKIRSLTETSGDLIQLEFNLTSITEAFKSTSTNTSMKRLSWVTFIFLPLVFVASIFGMNVDILKSNPSWWLYIPFAAGTAVLTLLVWLAFRSTHVQRLFTTWTGWHNERNAWDEEKGLRKYTPQIGTTRKVKRV
ncbi:hypothetical protein BP6252_13106 [Coleophoma cylindrospora]|uniref:Uncharacterized protein n=1 Tax=Coleophoma cylindrospora TaxID=1849047 RepID=A0A3D8QAD1_9HELO|nr:hypothetical protein BP6252_13106 [Coleophoma cylindrospora]